MLRKVRLTGFLAALLFVLGVLATAYYRAQKKTAPPAPSRAAAYSDRLCLARNLAWETEGRSHARTGTQAYRARAEMEAISRVVFKRRELGRRHGYRNTICEVVYQRNQFSWTRKFKEKIPKAEGRWQFMLAVADDMLAGRFQTPWPQSHACITHYKRADNKHVGKKPAIWFRARLQQVAVYGDHAFFCPKDKRKKSRRTAAKGPG